MSKIEGFYKSGSNSKGILFCHTLGGEPSQMFPLAKKFHKLGYTVSCPLYRGHGSTFMDMLQTDVEDWYQDVKDAYDILKKEVETVFVVGMSIGGTLAVKLCEEENLAGLVTINAPVIGFDIENDVFTFQQKENHADTIKRYREHRTTYFRFVTEIGQIDQLRKIHCPMFVLQGSLDLSRYKTSSQLLMYYTSSKKKQRKDYAKSYHLLLQDQDNKEAMNDIVRFIETI